MMPDSAVGTANVIQKINDMFDLMNSSSRGDSMTHSCLQDKLQVRNM